MALLSRSRQDAWLAACFSLLLGHARPWEVVEDNRETCLLPSDEGLCKAIFPRWHYDHPTQTCKEFYYGGCGGNGNNFENKKDCEQACHKFINNRETCLLPSEMGSCKATLPRWHYNRYTQTCKAFDYGGCGGNDNNFFNKEDCEQACHKSIRIPKVCQQKLNTGKCGAFYRRYYFNPYTMTCEKFDYGGCKGNQNRFFTKFSCLDRCLPGKRKDKKQHKDEKSTANNC